MRITRREFLTALGGTAGAAALVGGQLGGAAPSSEELKRWATPEQVVVPSICQQCPGGCGLLVRTLDGDAVGISGNPLHPINHGSVCPKAFGGLQLLHDPNRIKGPMIRVGKRGRFQPIGWEKALAMVAARLSGLRAKGLSHTVAILGGQYRGYRDILWKRFADAYGTPNYIRFRCIHPEERSLTHWLMQGATTPLSYDLAETRYILSFGAGLLESWIGPVHASQAFARLRGDGARQRGRFIQVDPRRSPTAIKADRWVPIVPGTDGFLALGIANAMIREGLYDRNFVERHTSGFEDWEDGSGHHVGFKNLVLKDYGLLTVSATTGVPVKTILEIARGLGTTKPAIVIGERGPSYGYDDLHTRMAIHSLNALVGNIGVPGGLMIQRELPLSPLPPLELDNMANRGNFQPRIDGAGRGNYLLASDVPQALPERMLNRRPYPVNVLFLFTTNPLANHPAKDLFAKAMKQIPFVISFSPFLDESTAMADLILPDHTYLERWQDDQVTHLPGFTSFSVARPAASPLHKTRNTSDVLLEIAKRIGGNVGKSLPWKKFEDLLREGGRGLHKAEHGYVVSNHAEESLRKVLEREGYWVREFQSYDAFWSALEQRGAWWDPTSLPMGRKALFKTPSHKFEFYSTILKHLVDGADHQKDTFESFIDILGGGDRGDLLYLPTPAAPSVQEEPGLFSLRLITYRLASRPIGGGRNQPWLLEQPAVHLPASWEGWVEVHPTTAADLGIGDGDLVWVESAKGRIKLRAKLYPGTLPNVVHIPLFGGQGPNPNDLIRDDIDPSRGFGLLNTTRVRIRRA